MDIELSGDQFLDKALGEVPQAELVDAGPEQDQQAAEPTKVVDKQPDKADDKPPEGKETWVPYHRFHSKVQKERELASQVEALKQQLAELQSAHPTADRARPSQEAQGDFIDQLLAELDNDETPANRSYQDPRVDYLYEQVIGEKLDREVDAAVKEYPMVDAEDIYRLIADPSGRYASMPAADLARLLTETYEMAFERVGQRKAPGTTKQKVVPRPASAGGGRQTIQQDQLPDDPDAGLEALLRRVV